MSARATTAGGRVLRRLGDHLLTLLAVGGAACIALVILSWVFSISIMMFRTGSMSPTITAGSIAVVREIPAIEMEAGDVVTVDRGAGVLPVTHRVVAIEEADRATGEVTFVMRGDANSVDDPEPYTAAEVRRVMFSVPGAAHIVQWFGNPYVLGGLTLGAAALVVWAFWPREHAEDDPAEDQDGDAPRSRGATSHDATAHGTTSSETVAQAGTVQDRSRLHMAGLPVLAALVLTAPGIDRAESALITGEHLRMHTSGNPAQMQNLLPGRPVIWHVGVWADAPDPGEIRLGITARGELARIDEALEVSVQACAERWSGDRCPTGPSELLAAESLDRLTDADPTRHLTTMPSDEERWLRVEVVLDDSPSAAVSGAEGEVIVHASGAGEEISAGPGPAPDGDAAPDGGTAPGGEYGSGVEDEPAPGDGLARTGASGVMALLAAGLLSVVVGVLLQHPKGGRERR